MTTTKTTTDRIIEIGEVNAGWAIFPIIFVKNLKDEGTPCLGITHFDHLTIRLESKLSDESILTVLRHECFHIILSNGGIKHINEGEEEKVEFSNEMITEQVSRGTVIFSKDNPELWELFYE